MPNFGIGIGSFIDGLTKGANVARQWDQQDALNKLAERQIKLAEGRDARAAESDALNLKKGQADLDYSTSERAANAPILAAQRSATLTGLNDDAEMRSTLRTGSDAAQKDYVTQKSKSIMVGKDDAGNPTYTVDGEKAASADDADKMFEQRHGSLMDAMSKQMIPSVQQKLISQGKVNEANVFGKWVKERGVQKGMDSYGRMMQALSIGDLDGAATHINGIMENGDYVSKNSHGGGATVIKSADGNATGIKLDYTNRSNGSSFSKTYTNVADLNFLLGHALSPESVFNQAKADLDTQRAAKSERVKGDYKLANDIELERVKSANKIAEERAKAEGPEGVKDYAKGVMEIMKFQSENNQGFAKLSSQEQAAQAADIYGQVRAQSGGYSRPSSGNSVPAQQYGDPSSPGRVPVYSRQAAPAQSGQAAPAQRTPTFRTNSRRRDDLRRPRRSRRRSSRRRR